MKRLHVHKPVSDWLKMLDFRTTGLNNVRVFSIGRINEKKRNRG